MPAKRESETTWLPAPDGANAASFGERRDSGVIADLRAALARAGAEGRWDMVGILADQLRQEQAAAAGNVVDLAAERAKR